MVAELAGVRAALSQAIPAKTDTNLLVGTWNVRAFDRVTRRGAPARRVADSDLSNVACIAEVVRRLDVIAIQEVRDSAQSFGAMLQALGPGWPFLLTDVTKGSAGNNERLAFVFDTRRGEPVRVGMRAGGRRRPGGHQPAGVGRQFARTPYAVSFARVAARFTLVTLHVICGTTAADRIPELTEIAHWLAD